MNSCTNKTRNSEKLPVIKWQISSGCWTLCDPGTQRISLLDTGIVLANLNVSAIENWLCFVHILFIVEQVIWIQCTTILIYIPTHCSILLIPPCHYFHSPFLERKVLYIIYDYVRLISLWYPG